MAEQTQCNSETYNKCAKLIKDFHFSLSALNRHECAEKLARSMKRIIVSNIGHAGIKI